jgi:SAM-dependent methyltransferase
VPRDWDRHYADSANLDFTPDPLLVNAAELLPPGRALDLACGPGRNALFLAGLGWHVTAVDRSPVAIAILRQRANGLAIDIRRADLEIGEFAIPPAAFDLVANILYLERDLVPTIREGVRLGGVFAGAMLLEKPGRESPFRVRPGEVRAWFADWKILYYSEGPPGHGAAARILARRA